MASVRTSRTRDKSSGRYASKHKQGTRTCQVCGASETSQWRTAPDGSPLCNKCGIKLRRAKKSKNEPQASSPTSSQSSSSDRARLVCSIRNITNPN